MLSFSFLSDIPSKRKMIYLLITFVYDSVLKYTQLFKTSKTVFFFFMTNIYNFHS